jgi:pyruvate kinase
MTQHAKYNKTKIVATIGPATDSYESLKSIIQEGVDVCRVNFSHGSHESHLKVIELVRRIDDEFNLNICILGDLQGPKLRIGEVEKDTLLVTGSELIVTTEPCTGNAERLYVSYKDLPKDIQPDERILVDDGKIALRVKEILSDTDIRVQVMNGGPLLSRKGFNLPETDVSLPCLTEKDLADLDFAMKHDVDWIALSFVRTPEDVDELKAILDKHGCQSKIIAKIEKPQAIENFDAILERADGIMVARGDLGVEIPMERVPMLQKQIVEKCIIAAKPVVIATQMMESMIDSPTPTRAETNDVANAVMDGADAVMLSAETSIGKFPLQTISAVERILSSIEMGWNIYHKGLKPQKASPTFLSDEICFTAVRLSDHINARAIISMTQSGYTAFQIASYRPNCDIFIFTSNRRIFRILNLVWNVRVFYYDKLDSTDATMKDVIEILKKEGLLDLDDLVVHTASMPIHEKRRTNTVKISRVE